MKKQLQKPAVLAAALAGATVMTVGVAGVSAATDTTSTSSTTTSSSTVSSKESSLVDKLVAKFGLNKSDVQAVFDQDREERQAERQQEMGSRLTQAVTDGKITEDQKSKILAKQQEMQTFMDSLKDKTAEERRTAMESKRAELDKWISDNNIPEEYARFAMGGPGGHGKGMGGPHDDADASSQSSSTSTTTTQ